MEQYNGTSVFDETDIYDSLAFDIDGLYPLIVIPLGTIGNLITLIVYNQKPFSKLPFGFYNSCLAIVDTLILYVGALKFFIRSRFDINITAESEWSCKLLTTSIYILPQLSSWIIVLISAERLFVIRGYTIAYYFKKRVFQVLSIIVCVTIILGINFPGFIYLKVTEIDEQKVCKLDSPADSLFTERFRNVVDMLVYNIIPFCITITCSILISNYIVSSKRVLSMKNKDVRREYQLSFTLLLTSIMFLLLNSPLCIVMIILSMSDEYNSKLNLAYSIGNALVYTNFCMSVFINLTINQLFTKQLLKLFGIS